MYSGICLYTGFMVSLLFIKTTKSNAVVCKVLPGTVFSCRKTAGGQDGSVIPSSVPAHIEGLLLLKGESNVPWIVTDVKYFNRFPALLSLVIEGPLTILSNLTSSANKLLELQDNLFFLPKIKHLSCINCGFTSEKNIWKLPWGLERLVLSGNLYTEYSISDCPYLLELNLENNRLIKMPQWHNKPPPLQKLYLFNNTELRITFSDISNLCDLKVLSLDTKGSAITQEKQSCDCSRIQNWIHYFAIELDLGAKLECFKSDQCEKLKIDEYEKKKETCLSKRGRKPHNFNQKPPFKPMNNYLRLAFIIVFVIFCLTACSLLLYVILRGRLKRKKKKYRHRVKHIEEIHQ